MNDGWYKRQQVLSELEAQRKKCYEAAADTEATIQATYADDEALFLLMKQKEYWYRQASNIETQIWILEGLGRNNDTEDDGSE